jgi:aminoglycoside/choline kinase family phosphotransferase
MLTKHNNPGVIDFQDAVIGPITYDLVSLLKDCYIKWTKDEINGWVNFYINELAMHDSKLDIDRKQFQRWFDLMGVQRHLKASGIFARLSHRDDKHGFLKDIPRTLSYIVDLNSSYKELSPLCQLIETSVLPELEK